MIIQLSVVIRRCQCRVPVFDVLANEPSVTGGWICLYRLSTRTRGFALVAGRKLSDGAARWFSTVPPFGCDLDESIDEIKAIELYRVNGKSGFRSVIT